MNNNPLNKVRKLDQSIWLDFIRRGILVNGDLKKLIDEDSLRGVTSNPAIFEKAIDNSNDYDDAIDLLVMAGKSPDEVYEALTIEDVQQATDLFRSVYDKSDGTDGFVSLEVSPHLAHDTEKTIEEARRLWKKVDRPNVMIKVPGTQEGLPAIRQLISEGVNINVTLLFGLDRYRKVTEAYLSGLEDRLEQNKPINSIASVASFFLSRIDVMVDPMFEDIMQNGSDENAKMAEKLHGQVAIASAKQAYQIFKDEFAKDRFKKLNKKGANVQRLLWASTSTKNPDYSDVKYVEALIGPQTVNTIPMETLDAYRDHGNPELSLEKGLEDAVEAFKMLHKLNIDIDDVTQKLEDEGVDKFIKPFDQLMDTLQEKCNVEPEVSLNNMDLSMGSVDEAVQSQMGKMQNDSFLNRFWEKDPTLWKEDKSDAEIIKNAMGWIDVSEHMIKAIPRLEQFRNEVKKDGIKQVVHMGMGGSSLAPLVFAETLSVGENGLPVQVLDTTDPATIDKIEHSISPDETLFIVASKSGSTAEPIAFYEYFYNKVKNRLGDKAGRHFAAITDPGSPLTDIAREKNFRHIFLNFEDIGGRYSALSYFGLVPAALMDIDLGDLLKQVLSMQNACRKTPDIKANPGFSLGAAIGELALNHGRNKLTFLTTPSLTSLGMWLEQLLAESTGKEGKGILPVAGETLMSPENYSDDRIFVDIHLDSEKSKDHTEGINALEKAGHPVIHIQLNDASDLVQEFYRWEIATAVAGATIGINAFNQPNVQESKDNTNRLIKEVSDKGKLPDTQPSVTDEPLSFYTSGNPDDSKSAIMNLLNTVESGDYLSIQAYLTENEKTDQNLQQIRNQLQEKLKIATTVGYGPRFLHSTGQFHKGGPNTGIFIQLTSEDTIDCNLPGRSYSFGIFKKAQALGDLEALRKHDRRVISIDLGKSVDEGLKKLNSLISEVLDKESLTLS
ncbi:MAG TPA: bifunctional transaldolase/phosoglucose isomerase [Balneolales bacterium]|nr:bifunctional transaldolase/phosoglucose isomerase [Balneolales bacterium]